MSSDTNRVQLSYCKETTYAVTPSSAFKVVRLTSEGLKQTIQTTESNEIRSDRQIADIIRTDASADGDIGIELSYGSHDDLLAGALMVASATWASNNSVGPISISAANSDNSFNSAGSLFGAGFLVGQWVRVSGMTPATLNIPSSPSNNDFFKVVSATTAKIIVTGGRAGVVTTESAQASVTILMGEQIVNGVSKTSFSFEKKYTDLSNIFTAYVGSMISEFNLNISSDAIITGSFSIQGRSEANAVATISNGTYTAVNSNSVMNAIDNAVYVLEAALPISIISASIKLSNNLRTQKIVGFLGANSMGLAQVSVSGTLRAYFNDQTIMTKYLAMTPTSLAFAVRDSSGNAYVIEIPRLKFTAGARVAGGKNQDVIADMQFMGYIHPTELVTIRIARFPGPFTF